VPQNGLDRLVVNAERVKVRCKAAPECMPSMPRERLVQFEHVTFGLVIGFGLSAL
jgi:hypothetical protein